MALKIITLDEVRQVTEHLANSRPDFRQEACKYQDENGQPYCIAAHALVALGTPVPPDSAPDISEPISSPIFLQWLIDAGFQIEESARLWLTYVQRHADADVSEDGEYDGVNADDAPHHTWREALRLGEESFERQAYL